VNLRDKYIQEQLKRHEDSPFMTYEQWLENLCKKLINENSLLCPIGDLDTIQSLLVEKKMLMEQIRTLKGTKWKWINDMNPPSITRQD
jgi:hypothetical protein